MGSRAYDVTLKKIGEGTPLNPKDLSLIEDLKQKELIKEIGDKQYSLTRYGEIIRIMGYRSFERTQQLEEDLSTANPAQFRKVKVILLLFFIGSIIGLLFLYWHYFDFIFLDY